MSAENTVTAGTDAPCRGCGGPVPPPRKRTHKAKVYCTDRCRSAHFIRERKRKVEQAYRLLAEVLDGYRAGQ